MAEQKKIEALKSKLSEALEHESIDYGEILSLASQLARFDPEFVRFSIDASHISKIGKELVGRQETAVSEVAKNAYDADASEVILMFKDVDEPGGTLFVSDDGHGMTKDQLINGFMRLSTADKIHYPYSPGYERKRAGRKGIGRFAAQRLGSRLTLKTQTATSKTALQTIIDWEDFEYDSELINIASKIEEIPRLNKESGTVLIIEGLRESWKDSQIRRIYTYLLDLIQPYPLSKEKNPLLRKQKKKDPGFKVEIYLQDQKNAITIADEQSVILKHAHAVIEGRVDENGHGFWSVESKRFNVSEEDNSIGKDGTDKEFSYLKNIHFKAHYFIFLPGLLPSQMLTRIRSIAMEKGGIRVYRNGFRVLPYGEQLNDWLDLDRSSRAREILPPHANQNFIGFVELSDPDGELFEETSSREGLVENEAFKELVDFLHSTIKAAVLRVAAAREKKQKASQKDWKPKVTKTPSDTLRITAKKLEQISSKAGMGKEDGSQTSLLAEELKRTADVLEEETQSFLEELGMLRVLASLGLTIGQFTHEASLYITTLKADLFNAFEELEEKSPLKKIFRRMISNMETLESYTSYFDNTISANIAREMRPIDLQVIINEFVESVRPIAKRWGITVENSIFEDVDLVVKPMHPSEWASILFNFFTNAEKAIRKKSRKGGKILIRSGRTNGRIFLEFIDDGIGIPKEIEDKIFDAFFTTSSPKGVSKADEEEIVGSGLGLKIVSDIVNSADGEIFLHIPPNGYNTSFRIEIQEASEEEREKHED